MDIGVYTGLSTISVGKIGTTFWGASTGNLLSDKVAVKLLHENLASRSALATAFKLDSKTMSKFAHRSIATFIDEGATADSLFRACAFVGGVNFLDEHPIPQARLCDAAIDLCEVFHEAHTVHGLVLASVSPRSILLASDRAILTSIRSAIIRLEPDLADAEYVAPEITDGRFTFASDQYLLGALLWHGLTGAPPFTARNSAALRLAHAQQPLPTLPPTQAHWYPILARAMAKRPAERFETLLAMSQAVAAIRFAAIGADHVNRISVATPAIASNAAIVAPALPSPDTSEVDDDDSERMELTTKHVKSRGQSAVLIGAPILLAASLGVVGYWWSTRGERVPVDPPVVASEVPPPIALPEAPAPIETAPTVLPAQQPEPAAPIRVVNVAPTVTAVTPDAPIVAHVPAIDAEAAATPVTPSVPPLTTAPAVAAALPAAVPAIVSPSVPASSVPVVTTAATEIPSIAPVVTAPPPAPPTPAVIQQSPSAPAAAPLIAATVTTPPGAALPIAAPVTVAVTAPSPSTTPATAAVTPVVTPAPMSAAAPQPPPAPSGTPAVTPVPVTPAISFANVIGGGPIVLPVCTPALTAIKADCTLSPMDLALARATADFKSGKLTKPENDSALYWYQRMLKSDKHNAAATAGVVRIAKYYLDAANLAKAAGDTGSAEFVSNLDTLDSLAKVVPDTEPYVHEGIAIRAFLASHWTTIGTTALSGWKRSVALDAFRRALIIDPGNKTALDGQAHAKDLGKIGYIFRDGQGPSMTVVTDGLAMSRFNVTRAQFERFMTAAGNAKFGNKSVSCRHREALFSGDTKRTWKAPGFDQSEGDPVVCVSYDEAAGYVAWLSSITSQTYRLINAGEFDKYAAGIPCAGGDYSCVRTWVGPHKVKGRSWMSVGADPATYADSFGGDVALNTVGFRIVRVIPPVSP